MNQSVIKKLVKAKVLEYEAIKEILEERLPKSIKDKAKEIEGNMVDIAKEIIWENVMVRDLGKGESTRQDNVKEEARVHKVNIVFGEEEI